MMRMVRTSKIALFALWIFVATLLLLEVAVRIWGYSEECIYDPIYMPYDKTELIPFIHKPGLDGQRGRGLSIVSTDKLGLRSDYASTADYEPKAAGEIRIAVVGNSVTFGQGVENNEDTFAAVLETRLNQHSNKYAYRVFNFGVSAYSVREMTNTLIYRMPEIEPDLVIMAVNPGDFDLSRTGEVDKYGYTYNPKLSGVLNKDSVLKRLLRHIHLVYLARDMRYRFVQWSQSRSATKQETTETLPSSYDYILQFRDFARENGLFYLIVLLPTLNSDFGTALPAKLSEDGVHYVDLSSLKHGFSQEDFMASKFDGHPSAKVHKRIGVELSEYISDMFRSAVE